MNIKQLNTLYYKKKDIQELEYQLAELNNLGSAPYNDMPKGNITSDPTGNFVVKKSRIMEKLKKYRSEYLKEYERINDFVNEIEDDEIRLIARLRFIKNKDWFYIAAEISPEHKTIHWTTPRKKLIRYLENNEVRNEEEKSSIKS